MFNHTRIINLLGRNEWILFFLGLAYALFWQAITPIQYTGDSDSYLGVAHMLLMQLPTQQAPIFRPPGYPLFLALTGAVVPGTFTFTLWAQALLAGILPVLIYRIMAPDGRRIAFAAAIVSIAGGTMTAHTPQIMTECLFTLLLFLGIAVAVRMARRPEAIKREWIWLALAFAAANTVRPIAGPMFWAILLVLCVSWRNGGLWPRLWRKAAAGALLFIGLMTSWIIVDDVIFSIGARYSPLTPARVGNDSKLQTYLYDIPFHEAYFEPWARRVAYPDADPAAFGSLADRPAMAKIREIVREYLLTHLDQVKAQSSSYPRHLFGQFAKNPEALVDRMFSEPNYAYANYIRAALETTLSPEKRWKIFHEAAKDAGRNWPWRWVARSPLSFLFGPSRGSGPSHFLIAYTSRPPVPIRIENGPATRLMMHTLADILHHSPELWHPMKSDSRFGPFVGHPETLIETMMKNPNPQYAWFMNVMLWNLMGYDKASELMNRVAFEAYALHPLPLMARNLEMTLMVAAGPSIRINNDPADSGFAPIEIYGYLETPQLQARQLEEIRTARDRYGPSYRTWRKVTNELYRWFHMLKPFFFCASLMALGILWAQNRLLIPALLIIPYSISVLIYGILFTSLPRYVDPTLIIPVMITLLALPACAKLIRERREMRAADARGAGKGEG